MNSCLLLSVLVAVALASVSALPPRQTLLRHPQFDGRIVGGHPIDISEAPFQISLHNGGGYICGGAIVSSRFILTAAHCTDRRMAHQLSVRVGSSYYGSGGLLLRVKKIHQHERYDASTIDYDYSVLELEEEISFDDTKQPIELPEHEEAVEEGTILDVSGWGNTQSPSESNRILRRASVPKVSHDYCDRAYEGITDRMLCAGFEEGGKDACHGDSGGPLYTNGTLFGVVSYGYGCAKPNYPGVYSRVAAVVDWVNDIINRI